MDRGKKKRKRKPAVRQGKEENARSNSGSLNFDGYVFGRRKLLNFRRPQA
jgi:hypothetical protein